ncbi:serine/threonine-protein kinase [Streptomyces sp. AM8-1-1]|uniref:serine/threonine-protein kinase n=1 Tax=Streptomyces sp. AM8-1-1 TaxID=3075825 RepID=UPI0039B6EE1F
MGARVPENQLIAGRYRLLSPLGEGGMGVVWRARDEVLAREVAVKEVRAPAGLGTTDERRLYQRLEREAWAAGRISHRNVVTVYDVATEDGRPWIVMELVRGLALSDVLEAEGPLTPQRAAHVGAEVLAALRAAHEAGVLHRDVKPGNVLVANDGRVVLTDFGIATVEGTSNLTMTGELIGSPEFLAPERALGRNPGPESDLWSLGVLLYAAVEGITPFRQNTPLNTLRAVVDEELPPPRRAAELTPVIAGLLRKDPADRLPADEAERMLRVVGAGGTARTSVPPVSGPYSPTMTSTSPGTPPPTGPGRPVPTMAGMAATAPTPAPRQGHPRRAKVALAAGIAVLLLAAGGLAWALAGNDKGNGTNAGDDGGGTETPGAATAGTAGTGSSPDATGGDTGTETDDGGSGGDGGATGGNGASTHDRPQTVSVHISTVHDSYSGTCPPPEAEAPAFRATITVGRVPAAVEYRWATESGKGSDTGWKTLRFGSGDGKQRDVNHVERNHRNYAEGDTYHDRIRVEIRKPVEARSGWVDFSVSCDEESPSGGDSSPDGDSYSPGTGGGADVADPADPVDSAAAAAGRTGLTRER